MKGVRCQQVRIHHIAIPKCIMAASCTMAIAKGLGIDIGQ
jgi:hypothetical protein